MIVQVISRFTVMIKDVEVRYPEPVPDKQLDKEGEAFATWKSKLNNPSAIQIKANKRFTQ